MKDFIKNALSSNGTPSSKRLIPFLAFLVMAIGYFANTFFKVMVSTDLNDGMKIIVLVGLGATASEAFSPKKPSIVSEIVKESSSETSTSIVAEKVVDKSNDQPVIN